MYKKKYCMTCGNAMAEISSKAKTLFVCSYCGEVVHKIGNRYIYGGTLRGSVGARRFIECVVGDVGTTNSAS